MIESPFLRIPHYDEEPALIHFNCWAPSSQVQHWVGNSAGMQDCAAVNCAHCLKADRPGVWYTLPVIDLRTNRGLWITVPFGLYRELHGLREELGDKMIHDFVFEIRKAKNPIHSFIIRKLPRSLALP